MLIIKSNNSQSIRMRGCSEVQKSKIFLSLALVIRGVEQSMVCTRQQKEVELSRRVTKKSCHAIYRGWALGSKERQHKISWELRHIPHTETEGNSKEKWQHTLAMLEKNLAAKPLKKLCWNLWKKHRTRSTSDSHFHSEFLSHYYYNKYN